MRDVLPIVGIWVGQALHGLDVALELELGIPLLCDERLSGDLVLQIGRSSASRHG